MANAGIYQQFLQPARGIADFIGEMDAQDMRAQQLQGMRSQNQLQQLAMRQKMDADAQASQDRNALQVLASTAKSPDEMIRGLRASGRASLMDRADMLEKAMLERGKTVSETEKNKALTGKAQADTEKEQLAAIRQRAEMTLQAVSAAKDQASYTQAVQFLAQNGVDVSKIPAQFDPQYVAQAGQQALTVAQRADQVWKQKGYDLDVQKFGESARHNKAQEGLTARGQNMADARSRESNQLTREANQSVYDAERGVVVNKATGLARPAATMDGKPIGTKEKPLTEGQAKAVAFASRMESSNATIADLEKAGRTVSTPGSRMGFGVGAAINVVNSPEGRQLDQAKRDFVNAVLRRESGAVISDQEFANAEKQYFPQVGDDPATKSQKARNRKVAIEGMKADVPAGYKDDLERIANTGKPAAGGKAPSVSNW